MALFGITKIDYCKANALAFSGAYNQFYGVASEPTNTFTNICDVVKNRATLSIEQQVVNKEVLYTSRLVFVTDTDPMLASDYYAFVVTTNAGERILIGAQNRPRTIVTTAQNVAATAGDLTAYTTTVEWQTNYRPLRLPVTVTPVTDTRQFDICCGQIARPVAPDTRQFDICCGKIIGTPEVLTVIWQNYDGTELERKNYFEGTPEPTTSIVPTRRGDGTYGYTFDVWELYSQTATTKIYRAHYIAAALPEKPLHFYVYFTATGTVATTKTLFYGDVNGSTTQRNLFESSDVGQKDIFVGANQYFYNANYFKFPQSEAFTVLTVDWDYLFDWYPNLTPIVDNNNPSLIIGYYSENWEGDI